MKTNLNTAKKKKKLQNSNRNFGILFFIVFLIYALWPLLNNSQLKLWSLITAIIFLLLGFFIPKLLNPLNITWIKFGELLGRIISPVVMAIIFFAIVTPTGLLMRLMGKDLLKLKSSKNSSYWIKRKKNVGSMKRQF
jgi:hypothetical protein